MQYFQRHLLSAELDKKNIIVPVEYLMDLARTLQNSELSDDNLIIAEAIEDLAIQIFALSCEIGNEADEQQARRLNCEAIELSRMYKDIYNIHRVLDPDKIRRVKFSLGDVPEEDVWVFGDEFRLKNIFYQILRQSIMKYSVSSVAFSSEIKSNSGPHVVVDSTILFYPKEDFQFQKETINSHLIGDPLNATSIKKMMDLVGVKASVTVEDNIARILLNTVFESTVD